MNRRTFLRSVILGTLAAPLVKRRQKALTGTWISRYWQPPVERVIPINVIQHGYDGPRERFAGSVERDIWLKDRTAALCFHDRRHAIGLTREQVDNRVLSSEFWRVEYRPDLLADHQVELLRSRVRVRHLGTISG